MTDQLIHKINDEWTDIYYYLHQKYQDKVSHQAIRILQQIDKEEYVTIGKISEKLMVSHNTASEHVKRLTQKGYVVKKKCSTDERIVVLELTNKGKSALYLNTTLDEEKLRIVLSHLTSDEQKIIENAFLILGREVKKCFSS